MTDFILYEPKRLDNFLIAVPASVAGQGSDDYDRVGTLTGISTDQFTKGDLDCLGESIVLHASPEMMKKPDELVEGVEEALRGCPEEIDVDSLLCDNKLMRAILGRQVVEGRLLLREYSYTRMGSRYHGRCLHLIGSEDEDVSCDCHPVQETIDKRIVGELRAHRRSLAFFVMNCQMADVTVYARIVLNNEFP